MNHTTFRLAMILTLAAGALALTACSGGGGSEGGSHEVRYTFTGTRSATVTYFNSSDNEVSTTASPPWSYSFTTSDTGHGVKVAAFSSSSGSATVSAYVDGVLKKTGSDGGSYGFNATTGTYTLGDLL